MVIDRAIKKPKFRPKVKKPLFDSKREREALAKRVSDEAPPCQAALSLNPALSLEFEAKFKNLKTFDQLPLSQKTIDGLAAAGFTKLLEIQRRAIPHALVGRDILGAAKTGSGKTLAFVVPLLENLYRAGWTKDDGVGAIIISPTRELSMQIFEVLKKVGKLHSFSAGLLIGGMVRGEALKNEKKRVSLMNVIVCTPGRLLQHMDETFGFHCDGLSLLVLDEADRLLDLGFRRELGGIIANLPVERQTMLFSATQTSSVQALSRLSLVTPEVVAPHSESIKATPSKLKQTYVIVEAHDKLEKFFKFLKTHLKNKIVVFVSCRKQSKFLFEMFRRIRPGIPLACIHGKQTQTKRIKILTKFQNSRRSCLFTTDVCSRGVDIRGVDWVLNFDCPEDAQAYLHRVGRTARNSAGGSAVLYLLPSEARMAERLAAARIPIEADGRRRGAGPRERVVLSERFASFMAEDEELKYLAQKAFACYVRAVDKSASKEIFDLSKIDLPKLCKSMGLPNTPVITTVKRLSLPKNTPHDLQTLLKPGPAAAKRQKAELSETDRIVKRQNATVYRKSKVELNGDRDENGDFFERVGGCK